MKKFFLFLLLFMFVINSFGQIELDSKFSIDIPESWKTFQQHNYDNYTLLSFDDENDFHKCTFYVVQMNEDISNKHDLESYSKKSIQDSSISLNSYDFNVETKESEYGIVVIINSTYKWQGSRFSKISQIYKYNNTIYLAVYSATPEFYNKYLSDGEKMFESFRVIK